MFKLFASQDLLHFAGYKWSEKETVKKNKKLKKNSKFS